MSDLFRSGFRRSEREVTEGIIIFILLFVLAVIFTVLSNIYSTLRIPPFIDFTTLYLMIKTFVELAGIISTALLILKMPYWGTLYMVGWVVGMLYFWSIGLVTFSDLLFYTVPSIIVLAYRISNQFNY